MGTILTGLQLIRSEYGLASRIADALGLNRSTVSQWRDIPEHHVAVIASVTGYPPCRLRPDLFPAEPVVKRGYRGSDKRSGQPRGGKWG